MKLYRSLTVVILSVTASAMAAPISHWTLDDAPGSNPVIDSVSGLNASQFGSPSLGIPGVAGTAGSFPSGNNYYQTAGDVSHNLGEYTFSFWYNPLLNGGGSYNTPFSNRQGEDGFIIYQRNVGGTDRLEFWQRATTSGWQPQTVPIQIGVDQWYHVVVSYDATTQDKKFYVTLQTDANATLDSTLAGATIQLFGGGAGAPKVGIGTRGSGALPLNGGYLDDIQLYDVALSDTHVNFLFQNPGKTVAIWDGSVGVWEDASHWTGNVVPNLTATDSAFIEGGTVTYDGFAVGGDLTINNNNSLNISDGSLVQSTTHWIRIGEGSQGTVNQTGGTFDAGAANNFLLGSGGGTGTYNLEGGTLITKVLATSGTPDFNFGGGTLQAAATFTSTIPMTLTGIGGDATVDTSGNNITLSGQIDGPAGLIKDGAGTLILNGANNYGGTTTVNEGTIRIGNSSALGAFQAGRPVTQVIVNSGGAIDFNGVIDATYGYTIAGTGVGGTGALVNNGATIGTGIAQASNIALSADASIGGTSNWALLTNGYNPTSLDLGGFTLTKTGANTISLVSTTTTAGTIQVSQGTLALGGPNGGTGVNGSASAFTLDNIAGTGLSVVRDSSIGSLAGGGTTGGNVSIGNGATLTVGALGTSTTFSGMISGAGALTKTGAGTLQLNRSGGNDAAIAGGVVVNGGTLRLGGAGAGFNEGYFGGSQSITVNAGATLEAAAAWNLSDSNVVNVNGGTLSFLADNYLNNVNLDEGTITTTGAGRPWRTGNWAPGVINVNNSGAGSSNISGLLTFVGTGAAPTTTFNVADGTAPVDLTVSSTIFDHPGFEGDMRLIKTGAGTLALTNTTNSWSGGLSINGGVVTVSQLTPGSTAGQLGGAPGIAALLSFDGGTLQYTGGSVGGINRSFTLNAGGGTIDITNPSTTVTWTDNSGAGPIVGSGSLTKTGPGTLVISDLTGGAGQGNSYSGGTIVDSGTLAGISVGAASSPFGTGPITLNGANNASLFGRGGDTVIDNNIVVTSGGGTSTIGTDSGTRTIYNGTVNINKDVVFRGSATDRTTYLGVISGNGNILVNGGGRTTFQGNNNTFVGDVDIQGAGTVLQVGNPGGGNEIPDASNVNVGAGARFHLVFVNESINGLSGNGTVAFFPSGGLGATTLSVGAGGGSANFSGLIENGSPTAMNLIKIGAGTQELSSDNTYTGLTTVNDGVLKVSADNALGASGAGQGTTVNSPGAVELATGVDTAEPFFLNGAGSGLGALFLNDGGSATASGPIVIASDATIGAFDGSTLNLDGPIDKNGTTVTFLGNGAATNFININQGVTGTALGSDLIVDNVTTNINSAMDYNGPTFVRNGGVIEMQTGGGIITTGMTVGDTGAGTVNHDTGEISIDGPTGVGNSGNLIVGPASPGTSGVYNLSGDGRLTFNDTTAGTQVIANPATDPSTLTVGPNGTFNFIAGTLDNVTTINMTDAPSPTLNQQGGDFIIGVDGGLAIDGSAVRAITTVEDANYTLGANATLHLDIFGPNSHGGSGEDGGVLTIDPLDPLLDSDLLYVSGDPLQGLGNALLAGTLDINLNGYEPAPFHWYDVLLADGDITIDENTFMVDGVNFYRVIDNPNGPGQLLQVAVPEPASIALWTVLGLSFGCFYWRSRKRS